MACGGQVHADLQRVAFVSSSEASLVRLACNQVAREAGLQAQVCCDCGIFLVAHGMFPSHVFIERGRQARGNERHRSS